MLPSNLRLLLGIRHAVSRFAGSTYSDDDRRTVAAIDLALAELLLREDRIFLDAHIGNGKALRTVAASLGARQVPLSADDSIDQLTADLADAVTAIGARQ